MKTDKLILDACCGPRMMWFDKRNPQAVFMDIRDEEHILCDGRSLEVHPDVIGDFRSIPFEDASQIMIQAGEIPRDSVTHCVNSSPIIQ